MRHMREWFPLFAEHDPLTDGHLCGSASCARPTPTSPRAVMIWGPSTLGMHGSSSTTATARPRVPASAPPTWPLLPRCHPSPP
eukprot:5290904-Prymnesium_polylepis.1